MKVVINSDFGGFSLSDEAMHLYLQKKGIEYGVEVDKRNQKSFYTVSTNPNEFDHQYIWDLDIDRDDPALIEVVEEMQEKANGIYSSLKVIEIPDDVEWHIHEYDGREHVAENHRTWC